MDVDLTAAGPVCKDLGLLGGLRLGGEGAGDA